MAQDSSSDRAWKILDNAWHSGNLVEQQHVLGALAKVRSARATMIFRQAFEEGGPILAGRAANLVTADRAMELKDIILKRVYSERNTYSRIQLVASLRKIDSELAKTALIEAAKVDDQPFTGVAFGVLQDLGPTAVPALTWLVLNGCDTCRETAAYILMRLNSGSMAPNLTSALNDVDSRVRVLVAVTLANAADLSGRSILEEASKNDRDIGMKVWASLALAATGDDIPLERLTGHLAEYSAKDVAFTIREIGRLSRSPLRDRVLAVARRDLREDVRRSAIEPMTPGKEDQTSLFSALSDPSFSVRLLAAVKLLSTDRATADSAMIAGFANATPAQQHMILDALTQHHATTEIEQKIVIAGLGSRDRSIQAAAVQAAALLGPTSVALLEQLVQSSDILVCASAADMLVEISPVSAIAILEQALGSTSHHVRVLSAGYLIHALEVTE